MNILFIGNSFPPSIYANLAKDMKGDIVLSCHNFEQSFLQGLSEQEEINAKAVLVPWVGTFPISYTKPFIKSESYHKNKIPIDSIGYCNLLGFNGFSRKKNLYEQLLKTFDEFPEGTIHVVINTFKYPVLKGFQHARAKSNRRITQTVIMMDMPGFEMTKTKINPLKKIWMRNNYDATMEMVAESDYIVALTKYFLDYFDAPIKHIVVEGMINPDIVKDNVAPLTGLKKSVLYTGTLMRIYGVMNLVDAFEKADVKDSELWICGSGEMADEIVKRSKVNPNIKFFGMLTSEEAWQKQREATILVNPRTNDGEYTKYSFPSKTLEYLLSGRPVIVNHLLGFPDEYAKYCIFPENDSVEALAQSIKYVLSLSDEEREIIGQRGRQFVIDNKNAKSQVKRIVDMLRCD